MKKLIATSVIALFLCFALIPSNVYAAGFGAGGHWDKTTSHSTTNTQSYPDYTHSTTDIHSRSKGGYVGAHVNGISNNSIRNFYRNEVRPYMHNNNRSNNRYSYAPNFNPPSFAQPSFKTPSFNPPSFSQPSIPHFGF